MNKALITIVCAAVTLVAAAQNPYQLHVGEVSMTIDAERGGKILSLKHGDTEIISQLTQPEAFGSTFWTSPQREWNWPPVPEFDKQPYTVSQQDGRLLMTSPVSARMQYSVSKAFATDESDGAIVVTYSIKNEADATRQVAPWEITRVVNEGTIFFDAPLDGITPSGLLTFKSLHGAVWYDADEAPQNRKVNADGKGWLAYMAKGLLLVKTFTDMSATQPAPGEAEIQVYVNQRKTYIELESQGPYTTLAPGQSLSWTVRWYLLKIDDDATPSEALVKKVKGLMANAPK